ncbi:hypothetical protein AA313_de0207416 [Arthrobotrys entomopaga]|nr:hypothetical protein AA313_de0207416 [Arthrobotrys entomopaga]
MPIDRIVYIYRSHKLTHRLLRRRRRRRRPHHLHPTAISTTPTTAGIPLHPLINIPSTTASTTTTALHIQHIRPSLLLLGTRIQSLGVLSRIIPIKSLIIPILVILILTSRTAKIPTRSAGSAGSTTATSTKGTSHLSFELIPPRRAPGTIYFLVFLTKLSMLHTLSFGSVDRLRIGIVRGRRRHAIGSDGWHTGMVTVAHLRIPTAVSTSTTAAVVESEREGFAFSTSSAHSAFSGTAAVDVFFAVHWNELFAHLVATGGWRRELTGHV